MLDFASEIRWLSGEERVTKERLFPGRVLRSFVSEVRCNHGGLAASSALKATILFQFFLVIALE